MSHTHPISPLDIDPTLLSSSQDSLLSSFPAQVGIPSSRKHSRMLQSCEHCPWDYLCHGDFATSLGWRGVGCAGTLCGCRACLVLLCWVLHFGAWQNSHSWSQTWEQVGAWESQISRCLSSQVSPVCPSKSPPSPHRLVSSGLLEARPRGSTAGSEDGRELGLEHLFPGSFGGVCCVPQLKVTAAPLLTALS